MAKVKKNMDGFLDKRLEADSFKSSISTYDENATVQKEISNQFFNLLQRFECIKYSRALEIGCCTGVLTEMVTSKNNVENIWLSDIVPEFCENTAGRIKTYVENIGILPGDIEQNEVPRGLNLVFSSSTFQWMNDLPYLMQRISESLVVGGHLAFSIFGPGTMEEITELTGRGLAYLSHEELQKELQKHLSIIHFHQETKRIFFPTVRGVLRHIQATGVGGLGKHRWTKSELLQFEKQYVARFGTDLGVPVSYVSGFFVAEKISM